MAKKSHVTNNFHDCQQRLRLTNKLTTPELFVELHNYNFKKFSNRKGYYVLTQNTYKYINIEKNSKHFNR